jgi:outer membrane PBP1 activator LpoA protein
MNTPARRLSRNVIHPIVLALSAALLLAGCGTTKDAKSRNDIATLKTTHLAFIDEFTEGAGKTWDDQKLATRTAAVDLQFTNAEQYEATKKKDPRRSAAISNLHSQFKRHAGMLASRKAFFRAKFAANLKDTITQNYDQALRGEDLR